jgi:superfamily II DNA or RNA helicase
MQIVPRTYQTAAIKAAIKGLRGRSRRALVVLATGLGKTLTVAFITKKLRSRRVLFLVHNNFILQHAIDEFRLVFDAKTKMATYNGMSRNGAKDADIVFATWQTMSKNLKEWDKDHFDLIIVDEAHHSEADTYRPVAQYFIGAKLGTTATPDRQDYSDIRGIFGPEVINVTLEEAIARGWLPRIEYHVIADESLDEDALQQIAAEIREGKKRFTMAEVNRRIFIHKRDEEIARIINGYNEKAVVFCASIAHAERLKKSLELASTFHSKKGKTQNETWSKNQSVLEALKNGLVRRVCAVNAFNEGVNVPSVGLVAFCRVTGALTIFRQQLGRGLRPGKDKLIVLDFVGNLERVQLVLEIMNKISDLHEQYTPRSEIEREGYVRQRFEVSGKGFEFTFSDKIVDLMKVLEHCEQELYQTWQEASKAAIALNIKLYFPRLSYKCSALIGPTATSNA